MKLHFAIHNFIVFIFIFFSFWSLLFVYQGNKFNNLRIRKHYKAYNRAQLSPALSLCVPSLCSPQEIFQLS